MILEDREPQFVEDYTPIRLLFGRYNHCKMNNIILCRYIRRGFVNRDVSSQIIKQGAPSITLQTNCCQQYQTQTRQQHNLPSSLNQCHTISSLLSGLSLVNHMHSRLPTSPNGMQNFATQIMFTNFRYHSSNRPSANDKNEVHHTITEKREKQQSIDNSISDSNNNTTASPLNWSALNAILSQLSSPPNILTMSRILATPYLSYLLISHHHSKINLIESSAAAAVDTGTILSSTIDTTMSTPTMALSLFLLMGFTDFLDGYIARTFPSTSTVLGTYLDPFADKFFISVISCTMWYVDILPGALIGLWIVRDVAIVGSVYWLVRKETVHKRNNDTTTENNSNHQQFAVMDPTNTPLKVQASTLSKINTTLQIGLIALGIASEVPSIDISPDLMTALIWITAGTTIGSSLGYLDGSALKKSGN